MQLKHQSQGKMSFFRSVKVGCGICLPMFLLSSLLLTSKFTSVRMVRISSPLKNNTTVTICGETTPAVLRVRPLPSKIRHLNS